MRILDFHRTKVLVDVVRGELLPRLAAQGFFVSRSSVGEAMDDEDGSPVIDMRRISDQGVDIVNIEFDPRGRPRFAINAAFSRGHSAKGVWRESIPLNTVDYTELPERVRLHRVPHSYFRSWFGLPILPLCFSDKQSAERACSEMWSLMPQVTRYLQTGEVGPNMTCTVFDKTSEGKLKVRIKSA